MKWINTLTGNDPLQNHSIHFCHHKLNYELKHIVEEGGEIDEIKDEINKEIEKTQLELRDAA